MVKGCWNCNEFDGNHCMKYWNNADPDYYLPDRDDKQPDDICDDWTEYQDAIWGDYFEEG